MQRAYSTGTSDSAVFFTGREVEHTPAHNLQTLFVTGLQTTDSIAAHLQGCEHIFFGANHSLDADQNLVDWASMISTFLEQGYLCSLDIPIALAEDFLETGMCEYSNFIPQLRVPIPYIRQWNYNTMLKLDDKDFCATNPGVWSHSLHELQHRAAFTDWRAYDTDTIVE